MAEDVVSNNGINGLALSAGAVPAAYFFVGYSYRVIQMETMNIITKEELKGIMDRNEDFVLINVLDEKEFENKHIPCSINISLGDNDFEKRIRKGVREKNKKVIVYCANFECLASTKAAERIVKMGYTNVFDYKGGVEDYCSAYACDSMVDST